MIKNQQCLLCKTLGISNLILSKDKNVLKLRLEQDNIQNILQKETLAKCYGSLKNGVKMVQKRPKKVFIRNYHVLGQDIESTSIHKLVELLLERDYPEIANFNGKCAIGPLFIPEAFISKRPKESRIQIQHDKKFPRAIGDFFESKVYDTLKSHFKQRIEEDVLVIQGEVKRVDYIITF